MEVYQSASKKPRLDFDDLDCDNDDVWGQDDLTAEEFDLLEIQATQSCSQVNQSAVNNFKVPVAPYQRTSNRNVDLDVTKQEQYALEGKIKLLTQSLEKAHNELREERLNRNAIINQNMEAYHKKETALMKEIGNAQSTLQFKDQEIKTVCSKVLALELQLKSRSVSSPCAKKSPEFKSPGKFVKRFNFDVHNQAQRSDMAVQTTQENSDFFRRHKLQLDLPKGELKGVDIVSSMLCNRIKNDSKAVFQTLPSLIQSDSSPKRKREISPLTSLVRLNSENKDGEIWSSYEQLLQNHLLFLKKPHAVIKAIESTEKHVVDSSKFKSCDPKNSEFVTYLKDLNCMLSNRKLNAYVETQNTPNKVSAESMLSLKEEIEGQSCPLFLEDERIDISSQTPHPLLQLLLNLAQPKTYPNGYTSKNVEMEWALACIVAWSKSSFSEKLLDNIFELPLADLISGEHGFMCVYLTITLLINFSMLKEFGNMLSHKKDQCLLCSMAALCSQTLLASPTEHINLILMVEDFLSVVFLSHLCSRSKSESPPCIARVLQGFISILWKLYEASDKLNETSILIFKKGLVLLLYLSKHLQGFKENRILVEDYYVSLVSNFTGLIKTNSKFREFQDDIHVLWDFQDNCEYDVEDSPEE